MVDGRGWRVLLCLLFYCLFTTSPLKSGFFWCLLLLHERCRGRGGGARGRGRALGLWGFFFFFSKGGGVEKEIVGCPAGLNNQHVLAIIWEKKIKSLVFFRKIWHRKIIAAIEALCSASLFLWQSTGWGIPKCLNIQIWHKLWIMELSLSLHCTARHCILFHRYALHYTAMHLIWVWH